MIKKNALFSLNKTIVSPPEKMIFRVATMDDVNIIFELMYARNPQMDRDILKAKVEDEVLKRHDGKNYGLFVADHQQKVLGFCRFFYSESVPEKFIKYPAPSGYYCMGIIVDPGHRKRGIARFLSKKREDYLKELGVEEVYSMVAIDNEASLNMHKTFGFQEVSRAKGYLTVHFDCGEGILFKKSI